MKPADGLKAMRNGIAGIALLFSAPTAVSAQDATVRGTVAVAGTAESATPVAGALVLLFNAAGEARQQVRSDSSGAFAFRVRAPAMYQVTVLSDEPAGAESVRLHVAAGGEAVVHVLLGAAVFALDPISVTVGTVETERIRTFRERALHNRALGMGRVYLREDVVAMQPRSAETMLATIPMSRCQPTLKLDGLPTTAADLRTVLPGELEGMEVYFGTEVPREFEERGSCGVALFWTRGRPEGMREMSVLYILVSGFLSAATFLLMR